MPVGLASTGMITALGSGENLAAGLDRACTQQYIPMGPAYFTRKRRRHADEVSAGISQIRIERRKAHIVADGQSHSTPRQLRHHGGVARLVGIRFPAGLTATKALALGEEYGVSFLPGGRCDASGCGDFDGYVRLCFAYLDDEELRVGAGRLVALVRDALASSQL